MNMRRELRSHPRFPVLWRVLYGNNELFGQGTVLNVSHGGCQVAAIMPVTVGMPLKLWIFNAHREDPLYVGEAQVRWTEGQQFGLQLHRLPSIDHRWLISFLEDAERGNNFEWRPTMSTWQ
jgi:hypothetical protein